jgi:hypothetical protein
MKKTEHFARKFKFVSVAVLTAIVFPFQNCSKTPLELSSEGDGPTYDELKSLEPGETPIPVAPSVSRKVDKVANGGTVAVSLVSAVGLSGTGSDSMAHIEAVMDSSYSNAAGYLPIILLSEYGTYDSVTPAHLNAYGGVAEKACERLIWHQELNQLRYDTVARKWVDGRRYFRGIYMGAENDRRLIYNQLADRVSRTGEINSALHPDNANFQPDQNYRNAIKRLARSFWGRDASAEEENLVLNKMKELQALPENATGKFIDPGTANTQTRGIGYRSSVFICTAMASAFDAIRK